jgi:predicted transcriptional regulator
MYKISMIDLTLLGLVKIMKKIIIITIITIILLSDLAFVGADSNQLEITEDQVKDISLTYYLQDQNKMFEELTTNPDYFIENIGQLSNDGIKYYSPDGSTWFTSGAVWIKPWQDRTTNKSMVLKHEFIGAQNSVPRAYQPLETYSNFYRGDSELNWSTGVRHYKEVYYENIYEGIDLRYYLIDSGLKYEFIIHPGTDPSKIRLRYSGADQVEINEQGELIIRTPVGDFIDGNLLIYQQGAKQRDTIQGSFIKFNDLEYGFKISEKYNRQETLIIDPLLEYSGLLGEATVAVGRDIKVDSQGYSYIFGGTGWGNFPTTPGVIFESPIGKADCVILKLAPNSTKFIYSTYLGGNKDDTSYSMAFDLSGNVYVTGHTYSDDFPTTANAYDKDHNGQGDIFISKLNPDATKLVYSTYIGGITEDYGVGMDVDKFGNAFVTGRTQSPIFPTTTGAYNNSNSSIFSIYVLKLNRTGSSLDYSCLISGNKSDYGQDIALDSQGNANVIGLASSADFPITDDAIYKSHSGHTDLVYFKFNHNGSELIYSTFIGGFDRDTPGAITLDQSDNVYITGYTASSDFPTTTNAYSSEFTGVYDVFVIKLNTSGSELTFSTFVGGSNDEYANDIVVDSMGNTYVCGYTWSNDFPTTPDVNRHHKEGLYDGFLFKLDPQGTKLLHSRYIGGDGTDWIYGITIDQYNDIYITGYTNSSDFETTPGMNSSKSSGEQNIFIQKYNAQNYIKIVSLSMPEVKTPTIIYPKLQPYNFRINLIDSMLGQNLKEVILKLDPMGENIQLVWNYTTGQFHKRSDPKNYVEIAPSSRYNNYYPTCWKVDFKVIFNWTYPTEQLQDIQALVTSIAIPSVWLNETNMYQVENDLVFIGELIVRGEDGRYLESLEINKSTLVAGGEKLRWTGLKPIYENSNKIYPPEDEFDISIFDESGLSWSDSPKQGKTFYIETISPNNTHHSYHYNVKIIGIPETSDSSKVNFTLRIDGDGVVFTNFSPETNIYHTEEISRAGVVITDIGGGLVNGSSVGYSYSFDNGSNWSIWIPVPKLESAISIEPETIIYFNEGANNLVKWRAEDSMGNGLVESEEYRVMIDTLPVEFIKPFPENDDISLIDEFDVGISISDATSGVDASKIEYSISYDYGFTWSSWRHVSGVNDGSDVNVKLTLKFPNGTANRIKWRAKDIAGNGPIESDEYEIQVNTWEFLPIPNVFLNSPENGSRVNSLTPSLEWFFVYNGTYLVTCDIYFGQSPNPELFYRKYSGTKYTLDFDLENGATYYWKIVPRANGFVGPESPIWQFTIDTGYQPIFDLELRLETPKIELEKGANSTVNILISNLGELRDKVSVEVQKHNESSGIIIELITPEGYEINANGMLEIQLIIQVDQKTPLGEHIIDIQIYSERAADYGLELERSIQLSIEVLEKPVNGSKITTKVDYLNYIYLLVVILIFLFILIFIRIEKSKALANLQRNEIYELIKEKPGIHFRQVMRTLSLKPGTVAYHINVLEKQNYIKSIQKGIYRCFYPEGMKTGLKIKLTKLQQSIVFIINENPGISSVELSKSLNKNRMVLHYNTSVLQDCGIITKEKEGRKTIFYLTAITLKYLDKS